MLTKKLEKLRVALTQKDEKSEEDQRMLHILSTVSGLDDQINVNNLLTEAVIFEPVGNFCQYCSRSLTPNA